MSYVDVTTNKGDIVCWYRDKNDKLRKRTEPVKNYRYFYIPSPNGTKKSMFGELVSSVYFDNHKEYEDAKEKYNVKYESDITPTDKFLSDNFYNKCEGTLKVGLFDIEADFDLSNGRGYPTPDNPHGKINSISLYDRYNKTYHMIMLTTDTSIEFDDDEDGLNIEFYHCDTERDVTDIFLYLLKDIDIIGAWNGCVTPEHKILKSDLTYVEAGELQVGDKLFAFDEYPREGKRRGWNESTVTFCQKFEKECCEIHLSNGEVLTATTDHPWFIPTYTGYESGNLKSNGYKYVKSEDLKEGMAFERILDYWDSGDDYQSGYLAAFFDGEGTLTQTQRSKKNSYSDKGNFVISGTQKDNQCLSTVCNYLEYKGYKFNTYKYDPSNRDVTNVTVRGGMYDNLRFLGEIRPKRLLENFDIEKLPSLKRINKPAPTVFVEKVVFVGKKEIVGLSTSSKTYIVEGYGSHNSGYDIPYLMERFKVLYGETRALSLLCRDKFPAFVNDGYDDFGNEQTQYKFVGRHHLDLMQLYRKFTFEEKGSYRLDNIASIELKKKKNEYEGDLGQLYRDNPYEFFLYSFQDTRLLKQMDEKLNHINIAISMSQNATMKYTSIFGSIKSIEGSIRNYCHYDREEPMVLLDKKDNVKQKFPGAIVLDTKVGVYSWSMSIDLTSLYPSVIRSLNMSPETYVMQCIEKHDDFIKVATKSEDIIDIRVFDGGEDSVISISGQEFNKFIKDNDMVISANGSVFETNFVGIIPEFLAKNFYERKEFKKKMKEAGTKEEKDYYDMLQHIKKIYLNSVYGAISNEHCRFFDINIASSVTLTGQEIEKFQTYAIDDVVDNYVVQE